MDDLRSIIERYPYLASPLALAYEDTGGLIHSAPHIDKIQRLFMCTALAPGGALSMCNTPPQAGKTTIIVKYGIAWALLLNPNLRIVLVGYAQDFVEGFGRDVREVVKRWGAEVGVQLSQDSHKKGEWKIEGFMGGLVCKGPEGGVTGRPIDLLVVDDLVKDHEQAMSPGVMDSRWAWWKTSVYGRILNRTNVFLVGTRWSRRDLFGRLLEQASRTNERWNILKLPAIALDNDPLGRKPGEALWPEQFSLAKLEIARQEYGPWFQTVFQQEPIEEGAGRFQPRDEYGEIRWPTYIDCMNDTFSIGDKPRFIVALNQMTIVVAIDIATGVNKTSDYTSFVCAGLTRDWRLLILDVFNKRVRLEDVGQELSEFCSKWKPAIVVGDDDNLSKAMLLQYRLYRSIPDVQCLPISGKQKIIRATAAIIMAENRRIVLPHKDNKAAWVNMTCDQLASFTGVLDMHDDIVDCFGILARKTNALRGDPRSMPMEPVFVGGRQW